MNRTISHKNRKLHRWHKRQGKAAKDPELAELDAKVAKAVRLHAKGVGIRKASVDAGLPNHQALIRAKEKLIAV